MKKQKQPKNHSQLNYISYYIKYNLQLKTELSE